MYDLLCRECGSAFRAKRPDKRYCTQHCTGKAARTRRGEQSNITAAGRDCGQCQRHFEITPPDTNQRYCSPDCARNSAKQQRRVWHKANPTKQKSYNSNRPDRTWGLVARLRRRHPNLPTSCQSCGESRVLELAHRPGFKRNGAYRIMKNTQPHMIWVLCPTCHKLLDRGICTQTALGLK